MALLSSHHCTLYVPIIPFSLPWMFLSSPSLYPVCPYHPLLLTLNVPSLFPSLSVTLLSLSPFNIFQQLLSLTLLFYSNFTICALHFPLVHPLSPPLHCHPIPHLSPLSTTPNTYFLHSSLYTYVSIDPIVFHP
jgi:hypothetical protein